MKSPLVRRLALVCSIGAASTLFAQTAPSSYTAVKIERYDLNRNGRLNATERDALEADVKKAAARSPPRPAAIRWSSCRPSR